MNRYEYTNINKDKKGNRIYDTVAHTKFVPTPTDIYIITNIGDRLDSLAYRYYNDVTMWWIIAESNSEYYTGSFNIAPGILIRIPYPVTATDASTKLSIAERNK